MNEARRPELASLQPGVVPLRPMAVGEILRAALATLRGHAGLLLGASFVVVALTRLLSHAIVLPMVRELPAVAPPPDSPAFNGYLVKLMPISGIDTAISALALLLVTGLATVVVGKAVLGKPITLGSAAAELRPRLLPLVVLTVLVSVLVAVGMLVFVVPGVWLFVLLALAAPALILERTTVADALARSRALVRGNWWRIFGVLLIVMLIAIGVQLMVSSVFELLAPNAGTDDLLSVPLLAQIVAGTLTAPFAAVVTALVYVDRRFATDDLAMELAVASGQVPPERT